MFQLLKRIAVYHCCIVYLTISFLVLIEAKQFEYDLPNRTVTICPTYSLISLECPQVSPVLDPTVWQPNSPQYLISIDYIRSYPFQSHQDAGSCQPDLNHACEDYDLRYLNTLCNGKPSCPDIPAYQIRDRSLCAFKAVTDIGYHCVPTWNIPDIKTKCDICKNGSLTTDYGFIYSRNYPGKTTRTSCFTTIYARPNHQTILYYVNGELNYDELRIESVTSEGVVILNISLNGNLTTQRLAVSSYEMKITFTPSHVYSYHPTYFLLYFYTIPICSHSHPCLPPVATVTTQTMPTIMTTSFSRVRVQSVGWSRISNVWIIIPVILAYIVLLILIIVLALFFQRRRKQQKFIEAIEKSAAANRYLETNGTLSRTQLTSPFPTSPTLPSSMSHVDEVFQRSYSSRPIVNLPGAHPYSMPSMNSFARSYDRYQRESQSDYNLHQSAMRAMDYYGQPSNIDLHRRGYDTMNYARTQDDLSHSYRRRRPLPKSFSDCNLCRRSMFNEDYLGDDEQFQNWQRHKSLEQREMTDDARVYRENVKERFRERLTVRQIPDTDVLPVTTKAIEYTTVVPSQSQRMNGSIRMRGSHCQLPVEYIPNENRNRYQRNASNECLSTFNHQQYTMADEYLNRINANRIYQNQDDHFDARREFFDRSYDDTNEVQELSMRLHEQPLPNRYHYEYDQKTHSIGNNADF